RGVILFKRASGSLAEPDLFADDDDITSVGAGEQSLEEHSSLVRRAVENLAERCLPAELRSVLTEAAFWHDTGKLDERFQTLLHHGDEVAALAAHETLAKSAFVPASPAARRALRE